MTIRFAAIGINHNHIYGQVDCLAARRRRVRRASTPTRTISPAAFAREVSAGQARRRPRARSSRIRRSTWSSPSAIPAERAAIAIAAMRHGKDVMSDKPGMTTLEQLAEIKRVQAETGRIFSVCYSEHFETRSTVKAGELVAGRRHRRGDQHRRPRAARAQQQQARRPSSSSASSMAASSATSAATSSSSSCSSPARSTPRSSRRRVANRGNPEHPGLQDVGDMHLRTPRRHRLCPRRLVHARRACRPGATAASPSSAPRATSSCANTSTSPAGRARTTCSSSTRRASQHIDCSDVDLPYGRQLIADVLNRTETAMPQARCFKAMELALTAQQMAERGTVWQQ